MNLFEILALYQHIARPLVLCTLVKGEKYCVQISKSLRYWVYSSHPCVFC